MHWLLKVLIWTILILVVIQILILIYHLAEGMWKYMFCRELDLPDRYGHGSWVLITGASSGQGRQFALNFAARGFNLLLIGSKRTERVMKEIWELYPNTEIRFRLKNFGKAFDPHFFDDIEYEIKCCDVSVLINCVGFRTAWRPYHEMPLHLIRETIAAGTIVQARLIHILMPYFLRRDKRSAIINITAQCNHPNIALGIGLSNEITVPYLSVYEASNAFGFYHANSIFKEYEGQVDFLNVTPGAVLTENTEVFLKDTPFAVRCEVFVNNIIRMMGNVQGTTCGAWQHALSAYLLPCIPWIKSSVLEKTGASICNHYMQHGCHRDYDTSH